MHERLVNMESSRFIMIYCIFLCIAQVDAPSGQEETSEAEQARLALAAVRSPNYCGNVASWRKLLLNQPQLFLHDQVPHHLNMRRVHAQVDWPNEASVDAQQARLKCAAF